MPVVSHYDNGAISPSLRVFILSASFLLLIGILLRRKARNAAMVSSASPMDVEAGEKGPLRPRAETASQSQALDPSALSAMAIVAEPQTIIPSESQPPPPPYPAPTASPVETTVFSSFESYEQAMASDIPRRRSYTKTTSAGAEMSGEIVVDAANGWRRHTKVFGGGVCIACEENERRMSA